MIRSPRETLTPAFLIFLVVSAWAWPISPRKDSKSIPSIEVKLSPPENPYPQVSESINLMTRKRLSNEEALVNQLEDKYNKMLSHAEKEISNLVKQEFGIFNDDKTLIKVMKASLRNIFSPIKKIKASRFPSFKQFINAVNLTDFEDAKTAKDESSERRVFFKDKKRGNNLFLEGKILNEFQSSAKGKILASSNTLEDKTQILNRGFNVSTNLATISNNRNKSKGKFINDGPIKGPVSFLEVRAPKFLKFIANKIAAANAPRVNVQLVPASEPSQKIEEKMKEIESKRNEEEALMFKLATKEMEYLEEITKHELQKNIQIQLEAFLVDVHSVESSMEKAVKAVLPRKGLFRFSQSSNERNGIKNGDSDPKRKNRCLWIRERFPHLKLKCSLGKRSSSFVQLKSSIKKSLLLNDQRNSMINAEQLNIKIGSSDSPYPTIVDVFDEMEKKRDVTERLERGKILQLMLRLCKAHQDIAKNVLHTEIVKAMALLGKTVGTIESDAITLLSKLGSSRS